MSELPVQRLAAATAGPFVILLVAIGLAVQGGDAGASHEPTHNGGMQAMSIDLDVAGNTATTLGPRDSCIEVAPGETLSLDVIAEGIPASNPMVGFGFQLNYAAGVVTIEAADSNFLLASSPGSDVFGDANEPTPDSDGDWTGAAADLSTNFNGDTATAESGDGVLERVIMSVGPIAPSGLHALTLSFAGHINAANEAYAPDALPFAHLAVDVPCEKMPTPAATAPYPPTSGTAPVLTPAPPVTPWPLPSGGMSAMSIDLDVAGNTATSLGPREDCTEVSPGDIVTFDITAEGIPESTRMIAFHTRLAFPGSVSVQSRDANFLLASTPGSAIFEVSTTDNDDPYTWNLQALDFSEWATIPPESGSGVLLRVIIEVSQSALTGTYLLPMSEALHIDQLNNTHLANTTNNATLVVGGTCDDPPTPAATLPNPPTPPTPGTSPLVTPTSVATPWPPPADGGMESMSIDLGVNGNAATTLGPRDNCIQVNPGDTVTFDVTAKGIPDSSPMIAFAFELGYTQGAVQIETASADYLISDKAGSSLFDASEPTPDADGAWNAAVLDVGEVFAASESGSGVLIRATLSISASASPGLRPLTLSGAVHIDPLGEARLPAAVNWAYLAIGATCDNLPTPPPTPVVTAPPTPAYTPPPPPLTPTPTAAPPPNSIARVGIDHNGGSPDINPGPATAAAGEAVTVSVVSEAPANLVGAYDIKVTFDPTKLAAQSCAAGPGGICNAHAGPGEVRLSVVQLLGLPSAAKLMDMTFLVVASQPACVTVLTHVTTAADTVGNPLVADAHYGQVCIEGATPPPYTPAPTAATTPTPPPGTEVWIGVDHTGDPPDVNEGPAQVPIGGTVSVSVVAEAISDTVGAWQVGLLYDPSIVTAIGCQGESGSMCNHNTGGPVVLIAGANVNGLAQGAGLARVTFQAVYPGNSCGLLVPEVDLVANTLGESLTTSVLYGRICIGDGAPPPTPAPLPSHTPTPAPPIPTPDPIPTYAPFPSPTPGGTAGPTPTPDGGPPVSEPTAAAQAPTSVPTPTPTPVPSTPAPSPTSSPTPTALAAVALPQTGGTGVGTSAALPVAVIGMAGLLVGSAAALSFRRRPEHR